MDKHKLRILVAKAGLDGHDRGIKIIARALRDAGYEVIYTGLHQTPEQIVASAIQEDVDLVGVSILSGAHMTIFPKILKILREKGREDIPVFGGGIMPVNDIQELEKMGVSKLFGPGVPTTETIKWVKENIERKKNGN